MPQASASPPRLVPALLSAGLSRSADFYARLSFSVDYPGGPQPPHHRLAVHRDGVTLFFTDRTTVSGNTPSLSGTLYIFPDDVNALADEWRGKVPFLWGPELMPYGLYEFGIKDPDGYHLAFARRQLGPV